MYYKLLYAALVLSALSCRQDPPAPTPEPEPEPVVEVKSSDCRIFAMSVEAGEWTRLSLDADDFKTKDLIPMKDWDALVGIILPDTDDKYYNNFLWM